MDIAFLDNLALNGQGFLHKASPRTKLVALALVITSVVLSRSVILLGSFAAILAVTMYAARLPMLKVMSYMLYPLFFVGIFALSAGGFSAYTLLALLKAVVAVMSVLLVMSSTSYIEIFSLLRRFMPVIIADGLFVTYRSFFIIAGQIANFHRNIKLRGGYSESGLKRNVGNLARALGVVFINSCEISEKMYQVMNLRGFRGGIIHVHRNGTINRYDMAVVGSAMMFFGVAVFLWMK